MRRANGRIDPRWTEWVESCLKSMVAVCASSSSDSATRRRRLGTGAAFRSMFLGERRVEDRCVKDDDAGRTGATTRKNVRGRRKARIKAKTQPTCTRRYVDSNSDLVPLKGVRPYVEAETTTQIHSTQTSTTNITLTHTQGNM